MSQPTQSGGYWNVELDHYNCVASSLYCVHSIHMHLVNLSNNKQKILYSTKMQSTLFELHLLLFLLCTASNEYSEYLY
jgi:hypothetical protein